MKKIINKKKLFLLTGVLAIYTLIVTPLLVINLQKQQETRGRAQSVTWSTSQSAQSQCGTTGEAQIAYSFTNTESSRAMNVIVKDNQTGKSVNLGQINGQQTQTGSIATGKNAITNGTLTFSLAWSNATYQTDQRTANYNAISCQAAATPTPIATGPTCSGSSPSDAMLIIDKSGSMNDKIGSSGTKISNAKTSANNFVDILSKDTRNRVGLVSFATTANLDSTFTTNYSAVKTQINNLNANGNTCIQCAIDKANGELMNATQQAQANGRAGIKKVVVLLTDGKANTIEGNSNQVDQILAEQKALDAANTGHTQSGTIFFTIGLGNDVNSDFLKQIASNTGGQYYFSPSTDQLNSIYQQISTILAKSSITGFVFNDANNNAKYDQGEQKLSGWTLQLYTGNSTTPQTTTSDNNGTFSFANLCDGTYTLKEIMQPSWKQTVPPTNGYNINISNGSSVPDANFGNYLVPTSTPTPNPTATPTPTPTPTPKPTLTPTPKPTATATPKPRCSDGIDNDNNGLTDSKDSTCHTDGNPGNPGSYDPNKDGEHGGNTCDDGKDNNNNGLIDGADPVCHSDNNPNNPGSYNPNLPEVSPTATPAPTLGLTTIALTVFQHGIGNSGDNSNPNQFSLSNKNPLHASIPADIQLYNVNNQLVASGAGVIKYNPSTGAYESGLICSGGNSFQTGKYNVKVKTAYHLRRLAPGIQTITVGQNNQLPAITLIAGDINNDNQVNIQDYNMLLDCYSDLAAAPACSDQNKKTASDLNDDGQVNQIDYNLFLREIATQPGE